MFAVATDVAGCQFFISNEDDNPVTVIDVAMRKSSVERPWGIVVAPQ